MKWIKASERLPEVNRSYIIRSFPMRHNIIYLTDIGDNKSFLSGCEWMPISNELKQGYDSIIYRFRHLLKDGEIDWTENLSVQISNLIAIALDESTMAEGQQQGEGGGIAELKKLVDLQKKYINWMTENIKAAESIAFIHGFAYDVKMLDEGVKMRTEMAQLHDLLNVVMEINGASQEKPDSSTFADTIKFLDLIDSSSMSDKTWLAEQKNLRQEGKELRERLTGKEIDEVIVKLKK